MLIGSTTVHRRLLADIAGNIEGVNNAGYNVAILSHLIQPKRWRILPHASIAEDNLYGNDLGVEHAAR